MTVITLTTPALSLSPERIIHQLKLACLMPTIAEGIASRQIVQEYARHHAIDLSQAELQKAADNFRVANALHTAHKTQEWLNKNFLTLDAFEEMISISLLSAKVAEHLFADKVEAYFIENQADHVRAIFYEIVLEDIDLGMELHYAIQENDLNFHQAAREYNQTIELRRQGGYHGPLNRIALKPEISAAVFAAQPPQYLSPIMTSEGIHLIYVEDFLHPQLTDELRIQIMSGLFADWLKEQTKHDLLASSSERSDLDGVPPLSA
jgi:parvulin-like peptidyl-prolyl isomerase